MNSIFAKTVFTIAATYLLVSSAGAAQDLSVITNCSVLYWSKTVDQTTKDNLKRIDDLLAQQILDNTAFRYATEQFIRACQQLHGDMTQTGPKMDQMLSALHDFEQAKDPVSRRAKALAKDPELAFFNNTADRAGNQYRQPACMSNINDRTVDILIESQKLLDESDINCAHPLGN